MVSVAQKQFHESSQDHNRKGGVKAFSSEAKVLARVHWFDAQKGGNLIGKRILCLTDTHFLLLIDCNDIDESDVRFQEVMAENSEENMKI